MLGNRASPTDEVFADSTIDCSSVERRPRKPQQPRSLPLRLIETKQPNTGTSAAPAIVASESDTARPSTAARTTSLAAFNAASRCRSDSCGRSTSFGFFRAVDSDSALMTNAPLVCVVSNIVVIRSGGCEVTDLNWLSLTAPIAWLYVEMTGNCRTAAYTHVAL